MKAEFIRIGNDYVNVSAIVFIEEKKTGVLIIHIQGTAKTYHVRAPEVEAFLTTHTVVSIPAQPAPIGGGGHSIAQ
jgi:hypothetical protein